jgi:hypothetical protein
MLGILVCRLQTYGAWIVSLTIRNGLPHPFSQEEAAAGHICLKAFFRRRPRVSMTSSEGLSAIRSYSNRKSKLQQVLSASSESESEDPVPISADDASERTFCDDVSSHVGSGGSSAHGTKSGVTVTLLGTQRMLISFVTWALMVTNIFGNVCPVIPCNKVTVTVSWSRAHIRATCSPNTGHVIV